MSGDSGKFAIIRYLKKQNMSNVLTVYEQVHRNTDKLRVAQELTAAGPISSDKNCLQWEKSCCKAFMNVY
jgi:hypothetical protein